jgi:hypothetical protein
VQTATTKTSCETASGFGLQGVTSLNLGGLRIRQVMVRGLKRVNQVFVLTMAAYNLTRMRTLGQMRPKRA